MLNRFKFSDQLPSYDTRIVYFARLPKQIGSKEYLLNALFYLFGFPGYFGFNWDALFDCLRDFSWIEEKKVVLFHEAIPDFYEEELKVYLGVLHDSIVDWDADQQHDFEVYFRDTDRALILDFME